MVRGRHDQCRDELRRPPPARARQSDRDHLGRRRPVGVAPCHLRRVARTGLPLRQCVEKTRRQARRPHHHLFADDPRGRLRHARLRAHRRHPFGGVRRLLARGARRPHRGCAIGYRRHRRRGPARRQARAAQGQCRRGAGEGLGQDRARRHAHGRRGGYGEGPRLPLRGRVEDRRQGLPLRRNGGGRPAVHPLYVRLDRQAQGRAAHDRRLSCPCRAHASTRVRLSRGRRLLVHGGCRLGDRPQLYSLWPARQWRDDADVRGRAELSHGLALLGGRR